MTTRGRQDAGAILRDGGAIDRAMAEAQRRLVLHHRALGLPLVIWRDGQVAEVSPDTVQLTDDSLYEAGPVGASKDGRSAADHDDVLYPK